MINEQPESALLKGQKNSDSLQSVLPVSPYKGLDPYTAADTAFFFGREIERDIIISNLQASRLTLLYGQSGVGKSSILQAGVESFLNEQAQTNLRKQGFPGVAVVVFKEWSGNNPIAELIRRIGDAVSAAWGGSSFAPLPPIDDLAQVLRAWTSRLEGELYIILDQFEEYFLYHGQEEDAASFDYQFPRVLDTPDLAVSFLVAIREDSYTRLDRFKGRISGLFNNYLRLDYLDEVAARAAIEEPLVEYNRRLPNSGDNQTSVSIESGLVERLLEKLKVGNIQIGDSSSVTSASAPAPVPASNAESSIIQIETPYLQLVLTRLWDAEQSQNSPVLRLQTLENLGGEAKIVQTHLDAVLAEKQLKDHESIIAAIFDRLVTSSGTKIALTLQELSGYANTSEAALEPLLEILAKQRILRRIAIPSQAERYEILHDVLAAAIIAWCKDYSAKEDKRKIQVELQRQRRQLRSALGIGAILLILLIIAIYFFIFATNASNLATQQFKVAITAQANAETQKQLGQNNSAKSLAFQSQFYATNNQPDLGLLLSIESIKTANLAETKASLFFGLNSNPKLHTFLHGTNVVNSVVFSPDGKVLASGINDNSIILWDVGSGKQSTILKGHTNYVSSVAFSPDGKELASGSLDRTIILWDVKGGKQSTTLTGHIDAVTTVAFSLDGKLLASGSYDGNIILWDVGSGKQLTTLNGHTDAVRSVAFSPDGKLLASGSLDKTIILWDVVSSKQLTTLNGYASYVRSVTFSPDGKELASGNNDNSIILWDVVSGKQLNTLTGHTNSVTSVAFSPDGKELASGSADWNIILWDVVSGKQLNTLKGHASYVSSVAFSPDGKLLASGSADNGIILWDVKSDKQLNTLIGHTGSIDSVAFSSDGKELASGSYDGNIILWDVGSGKQLNTLTGHTGPVASVAFSPDGKELASGSGDRSIILWDVVSGKQLNTLTGHTGPVASVAFSSDGKELASGSGDRSIILWDVGSGKQLNTLGGYINYVTSIAFSPNGKELASGDNRGSIILWDVGSDKQLNILTGHTGSIDSVAFSSDGKELVSGSHDETIILWDVGSGKRLTKLTGHTGPVASVAFSPDGKLLASGSGDRSIILWDVGSGKRLTKLTGHTGPVASVAFSPDGKLLASGGNDTSIILWDVNLTSLEGKACRIANRNLSKAESEQFFGDDTHIQTCPDLPQGQ
jgi:WD40 repeat protein